MTRTETVQFSATIGQQFICVCQANAGYIPSITNFVGCTKDVDAGSKMISSDKSYSGTHFYLITATDTTVKLTKNTGMIHVLALAFE